MPELFEKTRIKSMELNFPKKLRDGDDAPSRCIHCNLCAAYLYNRPLRCYHGKKIN